MDKAVRVRVDTELLARLDAVEAHYRGRGMREVSRSSIIRDALHVHLLRLEQEIAGRSREET